MRPQDRPVFLFAALAGLMAIAIAAAYGLGLLGAVTWRGIDGVRLLAPAGFTGGMLLLFLRACRGHIAWRSAAIYCAISFWPMSAIQSNSNNVVVQTAAYAVMLLAATMLAAIAFLSRKAKAKAA
ncbi:MAG: hypothetical protein JO256_10215 [Alphaproteobacteria bacterium]|nr:hypothetical protein [Alphaproteobacteria bacterium]